MNTGYHDYDHENASQHLNNHAIYSALSGDCTKSSPTQEYSQLLEAFTHSSFGDVRASGQSAYYDQNYEMPQVQPNIPSLHQENLASSNSPSSLDLEFAHGLRIHPAHFQAPQAKSVEHHGYSTVTDLEEAAAAASHLQPYKQQPGQQYTLTQHGSRPRRLTFEGGSQLTSQPLSSSHHSLSTASTTSSSQNSPKTPLSAHNYDQSSALMQTYQHQYPVQNAYQPSEFSMPQQYHQHQHLFNDLSASLPSSFSQEYASHPHTRFVQTSADTLPTNMTSAPLSQSHSRLSSAGLMDQVVSSRRPIPSPSLPHAESMQSSGDTHKTDYIDEAHGDQSRYPVSRSPTSTPPSTPARSGSTRLSRKPVAPFPASSSHESYPSQIISTAGPHRTPSKRILGIQSSFESSPHAVDPNDPSIVSQRPNTLRRSTSDYSSHTPKSSRRNAVLAGFGLTSPVDMDLSKLKQQRTATHLAQELSAQSLDMTIAAADVKSQTAESGMTRARSSPGDATSIAMLAGSAGNNANTKTSSHPSWRSSTTSALQMSPLPFVTQHSPSDVASTPPVSVAEALLALDQLSAFLSSHAAVLYSNPQRPAHLALGTQEQCHSIENIRRRIKLSISNGLMSVYS